MGLVSNNQSPEVLKPGKKALNLPSAPVTPQFPAVLGSRFFASPTVRCDHFNTALIEQLIIKFITVVSFIANQFIRRIPCKTAVYSGLYKLYFMGRSAFNVSGDRKTSSVCDCHNLGAFAALCLADSSSKVGELVSEIAAASNEQAQGIEQVNTAVNERDRATQTNAATAEESASASEEMSARPSRPKSWLAS